jgi:hypothetical protein
MLKYNTLEYKLINNRTRWYGNILRMNQRESQEHEKKKTKKTPKRKTEIKMGKLVSNGRICIV